VNNTSGATTGGIRVYATDQAYARLNVQNVNGQAYHLVAGTPGASNSGFAVYDATAGATRVQLDSSGNLGLGVTPSAWSSLAGGAFQNGGNGAIWSLGTDQIQLSQNVYHNGSDRYVQTRAATKYGQYNGSHIFFIAPSGTAGNAISFTQAMTLDASGNLLVGTTATSSSETLRVYRSSNSRILIDQASNGLLLGADASGPFFDTTGSNRLAFFLAGTERARITSGGDLLVGQTTADQSVQGIIFNSYGTGRFITNGGADNVCLYLNRIASDGAIQKFLRNSTEVGSVSVTTTATAYNTSSDYRLKDNPQPLTNSGAFIDALKPKTWNWKADGSKGVGFIAHEVQEVSPSSVSGEKDGEEMQAMEYGSAEFIANIVAELQSLRQRVAQLEGTQP
jgi:hypothetical protein